MWAKVNAAQVQQRNWVDLMQIDMMQLAVLQTQMDNLCIQTTLMVGFAVAMWGGETLLSLVKDDSQGCFWKRTSSLVFAHIFFYLVAVCISCCLIIVTTISYIKQAAQEAALTVSTGAAIALTRKHLWTVSKLFLAGILTFMASAMILIILYVGIEKRVPYDEPPAQRRLNLTADELEEKDGVIETWDGDYLIECINPQDPDANEMRNRHGVAIAVINCCIVFTMGCWGAWYFVSIRKSYQPQNLIKWYVAHQSAMATKAKAVPLIDEPLGTEDPTKARPLGEASAPPISSLAGAHADEDSVSDT